VAGRPKTRARREAEARGELPRDREDEFEPDQELDYDPEPAPAPERQRQPWEDKVPWSYVERKEGPPHGAADPIGHDPPRQRSPKVQCGHIAVSSERQCRSWAIKASDPPRCVTHNTPRERTRAQVAYEVRQWQLGDTHVDPAEMLLRLVSQSAARLDKLSGELAELVDEQGLQAALIGEVRVPTEAGSYVSGDYVRGLARLEAEERDRLAHFAKTALAAGLATRQVELAESQGRLMADVLRKVLGDPALGLSEDQLQIIPGLLRRAQEYVLGTGEQSRAQHERHTSASPKHQIETGARAR
jgi:hypothetical protein